MTQNRCATCGTSNVAHFDDALDAYFCDVACHRDYCITQFETLYKEWADVNLLDVES